MGSVGWIYPACSDDVARLSVTAVLRLEKLERVIVPLVLGGSSGGGSGPCFFSKFKRL